MSTRTRIASDWWGTHAPLNTRYLESNVPCRAACPVNTHAGAYVSLIAQGRFADAYVVAREPNPFASICGRVCAHPCEAACRRQHIDAPVRIRAMKRFVTEDHGVESRVPFDRILAHVERPRPPAPQPGSVAVIGAGPAGLSCAHDLALMNHRVTVFDGAPVSGGMMRLGIPEYRLPRDLIEREVEFIRRLGVDIRLGVEVGRDVTFEDLARDHGAVFIASGCRKGRGIDIPGTDLRGVLTAVDFLAAVNLGTPLEIGRRVVVVGGGNVAFDVARSARRFGGTSEPGEEHHNLAVDAALTAARVLGRDVTLVSLEAREDMPADPEEIEEGSEEGVRLLNRRGPHSILGEDGRVVALRVSEVARTHDEQGRFSPRMKPDSEHDLPADTVILAIGQVADLSFLGDDPGLEVTPRRTIQVDRATCATSRPGVFAGGDVAFGPRIIIEAISDGRRAARAIDTHLTGRRDDEPAYRVRVFDTFGYDHPFARGDYEGIPRRSLPMIPVEHRVGQVEVERRMEAAEAVTEGARCLHCWVNTIFDSVRMAGTECIQCGGCVDVCPEQCIDLVGLARIAAADPDAGPRLPDGSPLELLESEQGAALLKDETACIRCGLCARRCPTGVITMQAFYREGEAPRVALADVVL